MNQQADARPEAHIDPEGVPWRKEPCRLRVRTTVRAGEGPGMCPVGGHSGPGRRIKSGIRAGQGPLIDPNG